MDKEKPRNQQFVEKLMDVYGPKIQRYLDQALRGTYHGVDWEDLFQDFFVVLLRRADLHFEHHCTMDGNQVRIIDPEQTKIFVFGIAHEVRSKLFRAWHKKPTFERLNPATELVGSQSLDPYHVASREELRRLARDGLALLDEKFREPLVLFEFGGCSYVEIAAILGLPMGTVKGQINRAKEKLRMFIEGTIHVNNEFL